MFLYADFLKWGWPQNWLLYLIICCINGKTHGLQYLYFRTSISQISLRPHWQVISVGMSSPEKDRELLGPQGCESEMRFFWLKIRNPETADLFFSCFFCVFFFGMESHGIPNRKNLSPSHEDGIVAESTIPWKSDCPSWICADDLSILDLHFFWGFVYPSGARWPFRGEIGTWEPRSDLITLLHT